MCVGGQGLSPDSFPDSFTSFWDPTPNIGLPRPALIHGKVLNLYCNLICHVLLIYLGDSPFPKQKWRRDGLWGMNRGEWGGTEKRGGQMNCSGDVISMYMVI